ncbi:hypothetical protein R4J17_03060 [Brachyspira intermedia]|uniref:hypothetical protein n=1 Tax=Brachyspira intermedia TaxID=84377 RepID=UPI003003B924
MQKINLLGPNDIPPPTEFPNTEYPTPTPVPVPPIDIEEKPIIVKPEIVSGKTVFGGYAKRFKYKNEWYVLATNEYEYDTDTKSLEKTGKAALLKIANDGSTITKIGGISPLMDLEDADYWTNLISDKLVIEQNKVKVLSEAYTTSKFICIENPDFKKGNIVNYSMSGTFIIIKSLIENIKYVESDDLINWNYYLNPITKEYNMPNTNHINPNFLGRYGINTDEYFIVYFKEKIFLYTKYKSIFDEHPDGNRDPSKPPFDYYNNEYYIIDYGKDMSDAKNWTTNYFPDYNNEKLLVTMYFHTDNEKLYFSQGLFGNNKFVYNEKSGNWSSEASIKYQNICFSTEDGINWKHNTLPSSDKLTDIRSYVFSYPNLEFRNNMIGYEEPNAAPLEPSYTELNGKYYRTINTTYPVPPIKEIMETANRLETNFTITEEHIKKSGAYQLQVSSVNPSKAQESDWVSIVPKNEINSVIGWESGGGNLFTFNNKIVRLADYDREFQINNQYENAFNLSQKYYNMLKTAPTMEDYKKYNYYFLYYKAVADMIKMIKDKGNAYFMPDKVCTHYTFEVGN